MELLIAAQVGWMKECRSRLQEGKQARRKEGFCWWFWGKAGKGRDGDEWLASFETRLIKNLISAGTEILSQSRYECLFPQLLSRSFMLLSLLRLSATGLHIALASHRVTMHPLLIPTPFTQVMHSLLYLFASRSIHLLAPTPTATKLHFQFLPLLYHATNFSWICLTWKVGYRFCNSWF